MGKAELLFHFFSDIFAVLGVDFEEVMGEMRVDLERLKCTIGYKSIVESEFIEECYSWATEVVNQRSFIDGFAV